MAADLFTIQSSNHIFHLTNHDFTISSSFKPAVSTFNRTGHARFRRGPSPSPSPSLSVSDSDPHAPSTSAQSAPTAFFRSSETTSCSSRSTNSSSLLSPLAGNGGEEGSVSNGKQFSGLGIVAPTPSFSSRKPPLPSSHRKRLLADRPSVSLPGSRSTGCHCCKRRKIASKREVKRVPITGSKVTSVPADDYSWKKYGEKNISGSPYPRVYYKCSTGRGCPARKSVEVAIDDSKMLIVTYAGEHVHRRDPAPAPVGLRELVVQSK